jgi:hypothetical protein
MSIVTIIVMLQFFRKAQREVDAICDANETSPADYSVVIKNLPLKINESDYDEALKNFLEKEAGVHVKKVSMAYNPVELNVLLQAKADAVKKKQDALAVVYKTGNPPPNVNMDDLNKQI